MGGFIVGGKNAERYPTRLKSLEWDMAILRVVLPPLGLVWLVRTLYWKQHKKVIVANPDWSPSMNKKNFLERAVSAGSFAAIAHAVFHNVGVKTALVALVAATLSVIKNYFKARFFG